jgi:hypothetical protein
LRRFQTQTSNGRTGSRVSRVVRRSAHGVGTRSASSPSLHTSGR